MNQTRNWLGIDTGFATTGWAVLAESASNHTPTFIDSGLITTSSRTATTKRLGEIQADMLTLLEELSPVEVVIEMPYFGVNIISQAKVLQGLGAIRCACYQAGIYEQILLHQASWKSFLGNGRATKDEVAYLVQQFLDLPYLPSTDDAVDAIGICFAGLSGVRNEIKD